MPQVIVESGRLRGRRFRLPEKGLVRVGRDPQCALRVPDELVSRVHCILKGRDDRWIVEDQKSLNGTWVNGLRIDRRVLLSGDMIRIGESVLSFNLEDEDPLLGTMLAGYHIEARLGRGAMGVVYRARQVSLDRVVALKVLAPRLAENPQFVKRFLEEARNAGRLNHPNVVQVYDAGAEDDRYYIAMEYAAGGSLEDALCEEGKLSVAAGLAVGIEASRALEFARRHQIVHRDVKPANLLLDADGHVKLGDLGIAADLRAIASGIAEDSRQPVVGSPRYMAPEQARGEPVDHRADIYALGATLYRVFSGAFPFDAPTIPLLIELKCSRDPVPLSRHVRELPPDVVATIEKMMARDPARRFETAGETAERLERSLRKLDGRRKRRRSRRVARSRSNGGVIVLGVGVVVVVLIVALFFLARWLRPGPTTTGASPFSGPTELVAHEPARGVAACERNLLIDLDVDRGRDVDRGHDGPFHAISSLELRARS